MCKMTEKEICDVVLEQSSSIAAIKSNVKVDRKRSRSKCRALNKKEIFGIRILLVRKNKIWDQQQERLLCCGILPSYSLVPSFLLVSWRSPLASGLPVVFLFCPWCCSESEDSVINLRIQHSNCLWYLFDFLIPCTLSPSQVPLRYNLSITVCICTPCQGASFPSKTDSFLCGHGPDTLACKASPSFDGCGTSLSVSLSLSLSLILSSPPSHCAFLGYEQI